MTRVFQAGSLSIPLGQRTLVMGIVNVTPDSFSDGGQSFEFQNAVAKALQLEADGADILDIGGESTRPGSLPVSETEESRRVIPVIQALQGRLRIPISIDTTKSEVARKAVEAGAVIINDVSAGLFDEDMPRIAAQTGAGVVLMHMKGKPRTMQVGPYYDDLMSEVREYLQEAIDRFVTAGARKDSILVDPGIGFGKTLQHNLELIRRCGEFRDLAAGVLVGPSRKSFLGLLTDSPVSDRLPETIAAAVCAAHSGADVLRIHDALEVRRALKVADALLSIFHGERLA